LPQKNVTDETVENLDPAMDQRVEAASLDSGDLRVEVIVEPDALSALKPDYDRLCAVTENALPFTLFEWHETWCRHFLQRHAHIREQFLFFVVRDSRGICVAIFPLIYSRRRIGPFKSASVDLLGADPALTEIRGPLIEPGRETAALRLVRRELARLPDWDWDWVQWGTTNKALLDALVTQAGVRPHLVTPDYLIDLPENWETFRAGLKRNIRESLRHCYNSLKRAGHEFQLKVVCDPADVRPALDRFLALHVMRANMQGTVAHPNRFASEISREFLYEVSEQLARRGVFRLFQLCIGAEVVAARIGFQVGDSLYLYYSGFDPNWAKYGVMTTTVAEAIKYAIGCGLKTVNLSPSADISKTRWGPRVVDHYTAYENRDRTFSRVANKIYRYARAIDSSAPQIVRSLIKARREWE
jgi:CelD/BcsL family acetyltransferase involved in cellulose biosynthesis